MAGLFRRGMPGHVKVNHGMAGLVRFVALRLGRAGFVRAEAWQACLGAVGQGVSVLGKARQRVGGVSFGWPHIL